MVFCERLAEIRKESKLNQKEFAELIKVDASKYNKWENGKNAPDFVTVCYLADLFGTTIDYLLGRTNARNPENNALISDLQLSEKSIEILKSSKLDKSVQGDTRTLRDILNMVLSGSWLETFLELICEATVPGTHYDLEKWGNNPIKALFDEGNMKEAASLKYAHDILDAIIREVGKESVEQWAKENEKLIRERGALLERKKHASQV